MIVVLMGVAGSGKTTIGELLSAKLEWPFFDADDFHLDENVAKMAAGVALTDEDRWPWLEKIREKMRTEQAAGRSAIFACSALKESYRSFLQEAGPDVKLVYLKGGAELIGTRIAGRKNHFMKPEMLAGQLEALEEPSAEIAVDVALPAEEVADEIIRRLGIGA